MRARSLFLLATSALLLAACTDGPSVDPTIRSADPPAPGEFLLVKTDGGVAVMDASTGELRWRIDGGVPAPDWSRVYTATSDGARTAIASIDPATGDTVASSGVRGDLAIRAVLAPNGSLALTAPPVDGSTSWSPAPRRSTEIVIASPDGSSETERFELHGNLEPEAFSSDGEWLYLLQYRPAMDPSSYRVSRLYLEDGKLSPVFGPNKAPVENMTATRLQQVASGDAGALYTLYTNQPPDYLRASPLAGDEVAFIHTLSLADGFAFCTALPDLFGSATGDGSAVAVAPGGARVFAIDADHGRIAVLQPIRRRIVRDAEVDLSSLGGGPITARVTPDGATLLVAGRSGVLPLDRATLEARPLEATPGPVTGIAFSGDGARLFVSWDGGIERLDPATMDTMAVLPSPVSTGAVAYVGSLG